MAGAVPSPPREWASSALVVDLLGWCRFPARGSEVTCAVSGGADSLALLVLAVAAGTTVTAVHVDHGSRPGSQIEADLVAEVARTYGAGFRSESVSVPPGPNFEARARAARYGVLPPDVLTGHTADDQAETVLLNLMRGAALDGLAGMRLENRPLLRLRRQQTEALCARLGLEPFEDPTNVDPRFRRNRVRHELLPLLDEIAERDVVPVLARQAELLRPVVDYLETEAGHLDPTDARAVAAAPLPLARIAIRRWIASVTGFEHPVDSAAVQRVLEVAVGHRRAADVMGPWEVRRTESRLRLQHR